MTNTEILERLNGIQADVYSRHYITTEQKKEWKNLTEALCSTGARLGKRKDRILGRTVWYLKNTEKPSTWERFAPPCDHKNQCTTRALYFCLNETIAYDDIRAEQNRKAKRIFGVGRCHGWNTRRVWETVLTERGFTKLILPRRIRAYRLAQMFASLDSRILCHANHHCLSVFNSKVYDSWDSSLRLCDYILCREELKDRVMSILMS